uniref:Small integral membrane protein 19 n=2 Tax=Canis lupus familiaris TaxID=9615 RepID=A0A8I3MSS5_CANLF
MTKAEVVQVRSVTGSLACGPDSGGKRPARSSLAARRLGSQQRTQTSSVSEDRKRKSQECCESCCKELPMPGGYGVMGDDGSMDYSVHEAWNEATNVYLVVILVSFVLFMYAKRNKRKIMRIFSVPPTAETLSESSFYDTISKIRLRQQLEMYSISRKYDYQQPQNQADSVQLSLE